MSTLYYFNFVKPIAYLEIIFELQFGSISEIHV